MKSSLSSFTSLKEASCVRRPGGDSNKATSRARRLSSIQGSLIGPAGVNLQRVDCDDEEDDGSDHRWRPDSLKRRGEKKQNNKASLSKMNSPKRQAVYVLKETCDTFLLL